ncbi:electron carrier/ protein disulfide oxidoreductase [Anaeramoeba flamelloides]|uniref:Electron carrier/ protein disulfide oxidoreductase n=1 Tax=Anaeramoeba flamelloides TaxID=1746091 RepID=A0AAV7Y639_9EUKA|nr:electron carrier/ protein disulfide oxidoreductase [Anaeramoeba flamelloides]KAJ6226379.1 electron carrier/ protein disulfide oxidoreductase [Anaeramoeba flamelloides]
MGNLKLQNHFKQVNYVPSALEKRMLTDKYLLTVNQKYQIADCSTGFLNLIEFDNKDQMKLQNVSIISQQMQNLYCCSVGSALTIIAEQLKGDNNLNFGWELKSQKTEKVIWCSFKVKCLADDVGIIVYLIDLIEIPKPTDILLRVEELSQLTLMKEILTEKTKIKDENEIDQLLNQMNKLLIKKAEENLSVKNQILEGKKQLTKIKKEKKSETKKKKQKNKKKAKEKEPKIDKIGIEKVKTLELELKKLKFQKKKLASQDRSGSQVRQLTILKNKHKTQKKERKKLHLELENKDALKKEKQGKIKKLQKKIKKVGKKSEFQELNQKIKKSKKKLKKLEESYQELKQKIKLTNVDKELHTQLDEIRNELAKKQKINNQIRLKIAQLKDKNHSKNLKTETSFSDLSETSEAQSDFGSEDEISKNKTTTVSESSDKEISKNSRRKINFNNSITKKLPKWLQEKKKPTFEDIFYNQIGYEYFKEFLSYQYNVELLLFYYEVDSFQEYYQRTLKKDFTESSGNESLSSDNTEQDMTLEEEIKFKQKYRTRYLNAWIFEIIRIFIKPDSIFELDLELDLKKDIIQNAISCANVNIFDSLKEKVYQELSGEIMNNFQNSPLFQDLVEHFTDIKKVNDLVVRKGSFVFNERVLETLNSTIKYEGEEIKDPCKYVESLMESLLDMLNGSYSISNEQIDCEKLKQSIPFRRFELRTCQLQKFDLNILREENLQRKLSFMINLHNVIFLYSIIVNGPPYDNSSYRKFLNESMFNIGGKTLSLYEIVNLILPNSTNSDKKFDGPMVQLNQKNPKVRLALIDIEGIIPFIKVFYSHSLDKQLDQATTELLNRNVSFYEESHLVLVPRVFKQYSKLFGLTEKNIRQWIWAQLNLTDKNIENYTLKVIRDTKISSIVSFSKKYDFTD